jgi:hypothetical protein
MKDAFCSGSIIKVLRPTRNNHAAVVFAMEIVLDNAATSCHVEACRPPLGRIYCPPAADVELDPLQMWSWIISRYKETKESKAKTVRPTSHADRYCIAIVWIENRITKGASGFIKGLLLYFRSANSFLTAFCSSSKKARTMRCLTHAWHVLPP